MFCDVTDKKVKNKYPKMKLKAAELVSCLPAFRACWQRHMEEGSSQDLWIRFAAKQGHQAALLYILNLKNNK